MRHALAARLSALEQKISPVGVFFFGWFPEYRDEQCVGVTSGFKNIMRDPGETLEQLEARALVELRLPRVMHRGVIAWWLYKGPPESGERCEGWPGEDGHWPQLLPLEPAR